MSYSRPPFDAAEASWSGAASYTRPAHDRADASFQLAGEIVTGWAFIQTQPPSPPPVTVAARGDPPLWNARAAVQTSAPVPAATVSGAGHVFVPYVVPGLTLTLACRPYAPRPLMCPVYLDTWQPPCLRILPGVVTIHASAPSPPVAVVARGHGVQSASAWIPTPSAVPSVTLGGILQQDLALINDSASRARAVHATGSSAAATPLSDHYAQAIRTRHRVHAPQRQALQTQRGARLAQTQARGLRLYATLDHADAIRLPPSSAELAYTETISHRETIRLAQTAAVALRAGTRTPHAERIRTRTRRQLDHQQAIPNACLIQTVERQARPTQTRLDTAQQQMMWPLPGRWWPWYEPPSLDLLLFCDPDYSPRPLRCLVALCASQQPECPTEPPAGTVVIPIRRIYRVLNTVTLTRVGDGVEIPGEDLSLSLSADAWTWSWSTRVPGSALSLIRLDGEPVELLATINGQSIRLRIDSISRDRAFGSSWLSVRGRGRAAALASPTAASVSRYNTETRTAQQLLEDALTDNGVSIGWTVDWELEDWSVPAGAWSHTGAYIEAATRLAEAGGGYVQGHDTDQTLIVRPWYPVAPWDWADVTPDIDLPEDACLTEGIEWIENAPYTSVWVTGGRRDWVRRAGTDGAAMAQTIVDPLATDAVMTRQRGLRVLAEAGRQARIAVKLPVLQEVGIIHPGALVRYTESGVSRLGLSRSVAVECGFPAVWQTVTLEAHE